MYHLGLCGRLSCMIPLDSQYIDKGSVCALVPLYIEGNDSTLVVFTSGEQVVIQEAVNTIIREIIKEKRRVMSLIWKFAEDFEEDLDPISLDSYHIFKKLKCCISKDESKSYGYVNAAILISIIYILILIIPVLYLLIIRIICRFFIPRVK